MKIGIDARMLGSIQGGIGRYIDELVNEFQNLNDNSQFIIFLRKDNWDSVKPSTKFKKVLADVPWYGWREQICLPGIIKKEKVDLMHFPHWNIPFFYNKPFVVTIHDLLLLHYPTRKASKLGPVGYFFKNIAYRIVLKHAINKSKHIITPSEFTKNDIIQTFKICDKKISSIHLAPARNPELQNINETSQSKDAKIFNLSKYKITKPYILYVGVAYPHKNLKALIDAWKIFSNEHGCGYQLVLAGKINYFYNQLIRSVSDNPLLTDTEQKLLPTNRELPSVIFTDFVPEEELPTLYQKASLYIFPSLYEGFGLPPLEAMQYGVPVISSNSGSMPEILKNAALYFNPTNLEEIASAIWRGLSDANLRHNLNKNSAQLIHNFSWKKTAQSTLAVYKKML